MRYLLFGDEGKGQVRTQKLVKSGSVFLQRTFILRSFIHKVLISITSDLKTEVTKQDRCEARTMAASVC